MGTAKKIELFRYVEENAMTLNKRRYHSIELGLNWVSLGSSHPTIGQLRRGIKPGLISG